MKKKKTKKVDPKVSPYKFDTEATYIIPVKRPEDRLDRHSEATPTECHIVAKERKIFIKERPEYIFTDDNFNWYLHTGYIKVKEND